MQYLSPSLSKGERPDFKSNYEVIDEKLGLVQEIRLLKWQIRQIEDDLMFKDQALSTRRKKRRRLLFLLQKLAKFN